MATNEATDLSEVRPARAPGWLLLVLAAVSLLLVARTGSRLLTTPASASLPTLRSDFTLDLGLFLLAITLLTSGRAQRVLAALSIVTCLVGVGLLLVR